MKLLFDANLSPKLVSRLNDLFPESAHIFDTGLARNTRDEEIWEYAGLHGFVVVSADSDFLDISRRRGAPPKLIRIENCNYRTSKVQEVLPGTPF